MAENVGSMDTQQVVKCILVLWEQSKKDKSDQTHLPLFGRNPLATNALIRQVSEKAMLMNPDELTTCLLYLSKLGLAMHDPAMCQIRDIIMDFLKEGMSWMLC